MNIVAARHRLDRTFALAAVISAGLLSRSTLASHLPRSIEAYAGDTLWALALFLGLGLLLPKIDTVTLTLLALALAGGIELSQLYQASWINRIRATTLGGLILGFGFKWTDLICYTCGVALGAIGECISDLRGRRRIMRKS